MKHSIHFNGKAYRLRPVTIEDAPFIVSLRNHPERNRYIHATDAEVESQIRWQKEYENQTGDYYFVIENIGSGQSEGLASIYRVNEQERTAEWGRWIVCPGSACVMESISLVFRVAFEILHLDSLYSITIIDNTPSIRIIERFGMVREALLPDFIELAGHSYDAIRHRISKADWDARSTAGRPVSR